MKFEKHFKWFDAQFDKIKVQIPKLGETAEQKDPIVYVKLFYPDFSWTWMVMEFDGEDICYGLVDGDFRELGTFSLKELKENHGKLGMPIEIATNFTLRPLSQVEKELPSK